MNILVSDGRHEQGIVFFRRLKCITWDGSPTLKQASPKAPSPMRDKHGFTLMEVLVATAITGIALGVVMGLLAQGHRQAYRGDMSRTAAAFATRLIDNWQSKGKFPSSETGEMDGFDGWSYAVATSPLTTKVTLPAGEVREVSPEDLVVISLTLTPPGKGRKFVVNMWIPKAMVEY